MTLNEVLGVLNGQDRPHITFEEAMEICASDDKICKSVYDILKIAILDPRFHIIIMMAMEDGATAEQFSQQTLIAAVESAIRNQNK